MAGGAGLAEGQPGGDLFEDMIEGYPGSFWEAVRIGMIDQPELMNWNQWQAWRKSDGGLPRGVRGSEAQKRTRA